MLRTTGVGQKIGLLTVGLVALPRPNDHLTTSGRTERIDGKTDRRVNEWTDKRRYGGRNGPTLVWNQFARLKTAISAYDSIFLGTIPLNLVRWSVGWMPVV